MKTKEQMHILITTYCFDSLANEGCWYFEEVHFMKKISIYQSGDSRFCALNLGESILNTLGRISPKEQHGIYAKTVILCITLKQVFNN